jgi:hypothetical protein
MTKKFFLNLKLENSHWFQPKMKMQFNTDLPLILLWVPNDSSFKLMCLKHTLNFGKRKRKRGCFECFSNVFTNQLSFKINEH